MIYIKKQNQHSEKRHLLQSQTVKLSVGRINETSNNLSLNCPNGDLYLPDWQKCIANPDEVRYREDRNLYIADWHIIDYNPAETH